MPKQQAIFILLLLAAIPLGADQAPLTLQELIMGLEETCPEYRENLLTLSLARTAYGEARAALYPQLDYSAPVNYNRNTRTHLAAEGETDIENTGAQSLSLSPQLSLSQYLPTSGTVELDLKSSFIIQDSGNIEPAEYTDLYQPDDQGDTTYSNTPSLTITYSQPLSLANTYKAGLVIMEKRYTTALSHYLAAANNLLLAAAADYFNLVYLQSALALALEQAVTAGNNYLEAEKNYSRGRLTSLDLMKAEAALKKADMDKLDATENFHMAFIRFCTAYGVGRNTVIPGSPVIPVLPLPVRDYDTLLALIYQHNPGLLMARYKREISRAGITTTRAAEAPRLSVSTGWQFETTENSLTEPGDAFISPFGEHGNPVFSLGLIISGNIFDSRAGKKKIRQAEQTFSRDELAFTKLKAELAAGLRNLLQNLEKNARLLEYRQLEQKIAASEWQKGQDELSLGQISRTDLEILHRQLNLAELAVMQVQTEEILLQLELLMLTGADLTALFREGSL